MDRKIVVIYNRQEIVECPQCQLRGKLPKMNDRTSAVITCSKCKARFTLHIDQRTFYRKACSAVFGHIIDQKHERTVPITIVDLSRTGVQFKVAASGHVFKIGREYEISVLLGKKEISVPIRIVRETSDGYGARFFFSQEYSAAQSAIVSYLM